MKLKDKVAVITGSSRGMGRLVALEMSKEGAKVVVNGTTPEPVNDVVKEIQSSGGEAVANYNTVATMEGGQGIIKSAIDNFGKIDILVNNAAISRDRTLRKMTEEEWDSVIAVDLKGVFSCTKAVMEYMTEQRYGRIINVASAAAKGGNVGQANYGAAKAGVIAFTKTCARELGRYNITVNAVAPSHKTRMYDNVPEEVFKRVIAARALGRMSEEREIPPIFIFLASDDASFITGQFIGVDGGLLF
ncbi:MAG: 3-oxoacyl-ACP reductase family protein [Thermodesulfobacteriota bacterium]|nr:3-oxoacyl-ACP reductase family protein [Thermodesulfobacteriota bacterium]